MARRRPPAAPRVPRTRFTAGFALPTILITAVVMIMVMLAAVQSVSSINVAIDTDYYAQLADGAADAGLVMAEACLQQSDYVPKWSDAKPLRPNTDCSGNALVSCSAMPAASDNDRCSVVATSGVHTSFSVPTPVPGPTSQVITSNGTAARLRASTGTSWRTTTSTSREAYSATLAQSDVFFGYYSGSRCPGVQFFTYGADGSLRGGGNNGCGQLGIGSTTDATTPSVITLPGGVQVATDSSGAPKVFTHFLTGGATAVVIGTDGNAYFAGANVNGESGSGSTSPSDVTKFQMFPLPTGQTAKSATSFYGNTYVVTDQGNIYASGICTFGEVGDGNICDGTSSARTSPKVSPVRVGLPAPNVSDASTMPVAVYGDGQSRYALMGDGGVYSWGRNQDGQLGDGTTIDRATPYKLPGFGGAGRVASRIETGGNSTYVLVATGGVYAAGNNNFGQLGRGFVGAGLGCTNSNCTAFQPVGLPATAPIGSVITDVRDDSQQASLLTNKGDVYTMGANTRGQSGCGTPVSGSTLCPAGTEGTSNPVKFVLPAGVKAVSTYATDSVDLSASPAMYFRNTFVIGSDGRVYGAGSNDFGQLGNGCSLAVPVTCQSTNGTPVAMAVIDGVNVDAADVKSGWGTTVVRTDRGVIYTVGHNESGQLGDGTTTDRSVPKAARYLNIFAPIRF